MAGVLSSACRLDVGLTCGYTLNADAEAIEFHVGIPDVLPVRTEPLWHFICYHCLAAE